MSENEEDEAFKIPHCAQRKKETKIECSFHIFFYLYRLLLFDAVIAYKYFCHQLTRLTSSLFSFIPFLFFMLSSCTYFSQFAIFKIVNFCSINTLHAVLTFTFVKEISVADSVP